MTKKTTVKCPWCGRTVTYSKSNRIAPHVGPGGVKCVGTGQPRHQVTDLRDSIDSRDKSRKNES